MATAGWEDVEVTEGVLNERLLGLRGSRAVGGGASTRAAEAGRDGGGSKKRAAAWMVGLISALVGLAERGGRGFSLPAVDEDDEVGKSERGGGATRVSLRGNGAADWSDELAK